MHYHVYIIYSKSIKRFYSGQTQNLHNRLMEHNAGQTVSIRNGIPWELVWTKEVNSRTDAIKIEKKIKKRGAARFITDQQQEH